MTSSRERSGRRRAVARLRLHAASVALVAAVALADACSSLLGFNLAPEMARPPQDEIAAFYGVQDELVMAEFLESCADRVKMFNDALDGA